MGGAAPHLKAIGEGRIAARIAFSAIDHSPKILVNEEGTKHVSNDSLSGLIEF